MATATHRMGHLTDIDILKPVPCNEVNPVLHTDKKKETVSPLHLNHLVGKYRYLPLIPLDRQLCHQHIKTADVVVDGGVYNVVQEGDLFRGKLPFEQGRYLCQVSAVGEEE